MPRAAVASTVIIVLVLALGFGPAAAHAADPGQVPRIERQVGSVASGRCLSDTCPQDGSQEPR